MSSHVPAATPPKPGQFLAPFSTPSVVFNSVWPLVAGIGLAVALAFHSCRTCWINTTTKITIDCGVAIILAVSLNIVNGMTGQFSLGHAAFMALGSYAAGTVTYYGSMLAWGTPGKHGGFLGAGEWLFFVACLVGGLVATLAGYVVGLPSLRLRGDYLAIVTLGFGEILRVILQRTGPTITSLADLRKAPLSQLIFPPPLGGAVGFNGLPKYTNVFWVYYLRRVHACCRVSAEALELGSGDDFRSRR